VLTLGNYTNPSGKFYVGLKAAFELFPKELEKRVKNLRKEKWEAKYQEQTSSLHRYFQCFNYDIHPCFVSQILAESDADKKADLQTLLAETAKVTSALVCLSEWYRYQMLDSGGFRVLRPWTNLRLRGGIRNFQ
jgi:hypothetical protein